MISPSCDETEFIKAVKDRDYSEIFRIAVQEAQEAKRLSPRPRPKAKDRPMAAEAWKNRKWAIQEYGRFLEGFLFFMRTGIKPDGISDSDFQLFRPVCENLVQKEQFRPEAMNFFKQE